MAGQQTGPPSLSLGMVWHDLYIWNDGSKCNQESCQTPTYYRGHCHLLSYKPNVEVALIAGYVCNWKKAWIEPMAKKPIETTLSVRIYRAQEKDLKILADRDQRNLSGYVRKLINDHLSQKRLEGVLPSVIEVSVPMHVEKGPIAGRRSGGDTGIKKKRTRHLGKKKGGLEIVFGAGARKRQRGKMGRRG